MVVKVVRQIFMTGRKSDLSLSLGMCLIGLREGAFDVRRVPTGRVAGCQTIDAKLGRNRN
jgi:hypothetical protein